MPDDKEVLQDPGSWRKESTSGSASLGEQSPAPEPVDPSTGQHKGYWVLPAEERAKGFVRPLRRSYVHKTCGQVTSMGLALCETYARNPKYYGSTFCATCGTHLPVSEFLWHGTEEEVGS